MNHTVLFSANALTGSAFSGGDTFFVEMARRLIGDKVGVIIITSEFGKNICISNGLRDAQYYITDNINSELTNHFVIGLHYVLRAIRTVMLLGNIFRKYGNVTVILTSNYYCDTLAYPFTGNRYVFGLIHMLSQNPVFGYQQKIHIPSLSEVHYYLSDKLSFLLLKLRRERQMTSVITVTSELKERLASVLSGTGIKIHLVTYGVDNPFTGIPIEKLVSGKTVDFVWIGRNHVQKGLEDLKKILTYLKQSLPAFTISIIGDVEDYLRDFVDKNNLRGNIRFYGVLGSREKYDIMSKSKIMVFTSHFESYGIVIIENMICGNYIVGYDIRTSVDNFGKKMSLVPSFNSQKMSERLVTALKGYPQLEIIRNNYIFSGGKTWDVSYRKLSSLFGLNVPDDKISYHEK